MIEFIGYLYSLLFALCYVPQTIKMIKTKHVDDVSITTFWTCFAAYILAIVYTIYGIGFNLVLLLNYGSGLFFCSVLIFSFYFIKFSKKTQKSVD